MFWNGPKWYKTAQNGLFWAVLYHLGPFQNISDHFGFLWFSSDCFASFQSVSDHFGPFWTVLGHVKPFHAISDHFKLTLGLGPIWAKGSFWVVWSISDHCGLLNAILSYFETIPNHSKTLFPDITGQFWTFWIILWPLMTISDLFWPFRTM